MDKENKLILYKDEEGRVSVNTRFADEDVWLTREQLGEIYATTPQNISLHVGNIYQDGELDEKVTRKKFFLVRQEGKRQVRRNIDHYNLDVIIALGYRVQSPIAVRFRRWATQRLHECGASNNWLSLDTISNTDVHQRPYISEKRKKVEEKFGG